MRNMQCNVEFGYQLSIYSGMALHYTKEAVGAFHGNLPQVTVTQTGIEATTL
jgi:hypothetical protein